MGIMVKDGSAMERLAEIEAVVFDKTGTLTSGKPQLVASRGKAAHVSMASALALHSRHPLSQAIRNQAGPVVAIDGVEELAGQGIQASTPTGVYRLGRRSFACANSADVDTGGYSEVVLSLDGQEIASFLFEDSLRPNAESAIEDLKAQGYDLMLLSGDRKGAVAQVAAHLGLTKWQAELTPRGKCGSLAELEKTQVKALMVGDGINDAPALRTAYVSMAPATAADVGRQAADFVFMHDGLDAVPTAIAVSKRAGRLIREFFALAIGYNAIAVPIAIAGYATPLIASIAMSTSSLIVVANALRLNYIRGSSNGKKRSNAPVPINDIAEVHAA